MPAPGLWAVHGHCGTRPSRCMAIAAWGRCDDWPVRRAAVCDASDAHLRTDAEAQQSHMLGATTAAGAITRDPVVLVAMGGTAQVRGCGGVEPHDRHRGAGPRARCCAQVQSHPPSGRGAAKRADSAHREEGWAPAPAFSGAHTAHRCMVVECRWQRAANTGGVRTGRGAAHRWGGS